MSFLKPRTSFSSNFPSLSSVMRETSSVLFRLKLYMFSTKGTHQMQIFRLSTARINQIPCNFSSHESVFTEILNHLSVSWHIIPLEFSSWNFGQKEPIKVQVFRFLSALMKVTPIPHASFETTRSSFIQILHHCSVSWKISPQYFLSRTFILWTKRASRSKIFKLLSFQVKIYQIPYVVIETTSQFFLKLCITFPCHGR